MQRIINQLIQLQELTVARAQNLASREKGSTDQLDAAIDSLMNSLPPTTVTQFKRLQQKGILAIVPVSNNFCSACGTSLPKGMVQHVRLGESLLNCPSCARMLYFPKVELRGIGKRQPRNAPPKVGIARFSASTLMIPSLEATSKEDALAELCDRVEAEGFVDSGALLLKQAMAREVMASTSVDHGLAFPHVRGVEGGGLTLTLGLSAKGIKFDDASRSLTRIVFFMVIPTAASAFYLKLLSGLTQSFRDKDKREKLLACESADQLWKALVRITKSTVK